MKRAYISHPIAGRNATQMETSERMGTDYVSLRLTSKDNSLWEVILPRNIDPWCTFYGEGVCPPGRRISGDRHTVPCYMRADLYQLLLCDAVVMTPGWQNSVGCGQELSAALAAGIPVHFMEEA